MMKLSKNASLLCALLLGTAFACTGQIGDAGSFGGGSHGGGAGGDDDSDDPSGADGGLPPPAIPFEPLSVPAQVTKVKTLLTGLAATQAEIDRVVADGSALGALVDGWMKLPEYKSKMERFFAEAFQQSQAQSLDFQTVIDDGGFTPNDPLLLNFRQSFAKTMTEIVAEGHPFTEAATTTRHMMTTAMMTYYAYADTSLMTDATEGGSGQKVNRFFRADPKWGFSITARNVPLADSGNPASKDYLVFSLPTLAQQYGNDSLGEAGADHCAGIDPVVFYNESSFAFGDNMANWLYSFILGGNFWYFDPPQGKPDAYWCQAASKFLDRPSHPSLLTDADYSDWRMVDIKTVGGSDTQTRFFDIAGNRNSKTLVLYEPRVGYFTTPSFFSQYPTNISNQARATINQTMIVGLGEAFDGTNAMSVPGAFVDSEHAANPACLQCHWALDPMSRLIRSNLTLNYSVQQDKTQTAKTGMFVFGGVVEPNARTLFDLAKQIANHPQFKTAWTRKLCEWANSGPCLANDPEILRIADVFANHNYDWNALVHEMFTSPLITYSDVTLTSGTLGAVVPIARRAQLCATLDNRLKLTDVCGLGTIQTGAGGNSVPAIAAQLPSNGYSRGSVSPLFVNDPDPFFRSSVEQICALVAEKAVDADQAPFSSATDAAVDTSIAAMAHDLMGLDETRDQEPISILKSHYADAKAAGHKPTDALRSTFTAACTSPWVVSVGQ